MIYRTLNIALCLGLAYAATATASSHSNNEGLGPVRTVAAPVSKPTVPAPTDNSAALTAIEAFFSINPAAKAVIVGEIVRLQSARLDEDAASHKEIEALHDQIAALRSQRIQDDFSAQTKERNHTAQLETVQALLNKKDGTISSLERDVQRLIEKSSRKWDELRTLLSTLSAAEEKVTTLTSELALLKLTQASDKTALEASKFHSARQHEEILTLLKRVGELKEENERLNLEAHQAKLANSATNK
jgi:hypothetical protein